ncbi:MAG TPA: hypothetical protein VGE39_14705 [Prosthecobacter sp.]
MKLPLISAASPRLAATSLGLVCLLLAACSSSSNEMQLPDDPVVRPVEEQEPAYIPTYSKEVVAGWPKGRALNPHDISRVRLGEQVHAYHLGRLPSHDRLEMHEAHTVYRVEQQPRWDTRLPATPMDSKGVVLGVIDPARKDIPDDTIILQERQALARKSAEMTKTMGALEVLRADLLNKKRQFEQTEEQVAQIETDLKRITQERNDVQAKLEQAEARIKELDDAEKFRLRTSKQGLMPKK